LEKIHGNFLYVGNQAIIILYILERSSSWSTSEYVLCGLNPGLECASCWFSFPSIFLFTLAHPVSCCFGSCFALNLFLADWWPNASVQVNNTTAIHHIHTDTNIYITSILLFILFLTLLPLTLGGRLPQTLPVGNRYIQYVTHHIYFIPGILDAGLKTQSFLLSNVLITCLWTLGPFMIMV
jgi:hypothetical protein